MATTTKPAGKLRKLAISALRAIAIELLKIIPIIGPSVSVGIDAIWKKIDEMNQGGDGLTSRDAPAAASG
jgi:hypothetical protein